MIIILIDTFIAKITQKGHDCEVFRLPDIVQQLVGHYTCAVHIANYNTGGID